MFSVVKPVNPNRNLFMNNLIKISAVGTVSVFLSVVVANADAFSDSVGDLNNGTGGGADLSGFTHLDITSVDVTSTATDIIFKISLNGDILATD